MEFKEWLLSEEEISLIFEHIRDDLVAYLQSPSQEKEDELLKQIRQTILRFATSNSKMRNRAEDIAQETTMKALAMLRKGELRPETLSTWLYRVAQRTNVDLFRRDRLPMASIDGLDANYITRDMQFSGRSGRSGNPLQTRRFEDDMYDDISPEMLQKEIDQLPEPHRSLLNQYYFQKKSVQDLMAETGMNLSKVKRILMQARNQIRRNLSRAIGLRKSQ
jgi:RNA polymerase sigma factor (sigma-70 family)